MLEYSFYLLKCMFLPASTSDMAVYYLIWIILFLSINIFWDINSDKTPDFHLQNIKAKTGALYSAATFCSSMLLIISLFSEAVATIVGNTLVPVILAGLTGILHAISDLCPYPIER